MKYIRREATSNARFTQGRLYTVVNERFANGKRAFGIADNNGALVYVHIGNFFTLEEQPTKENQTMAQIPNVLSHADNARAFNMPYTVNVDPATAVQYAQKALADAEAALAAKVERDALAARIAGEHKLAIATARLLDDVQALVLLGTPSGNRREFAVYRKELQPLAASYECKIVLVGDKSHATLVQI